jgi:alpha-L-rhamnosidase
LTTGFVGTPHILHALSENGYCDIAYNLLLSEKNPSWLFAVNQGATTIWEHWDSLKENGEFWDKDMNSFNHYAYGSVFDWIFGVAMGVKVKENGAGYKKFIFKPNPDKRVSPAKASIETKQGKISVAWEWRNDSYKYYIEIPSKTEVEVILEGKSSIVINKKGKYAF